MNNWSFKIAKKLPTPLLKTSIVRMENMLKEKTTEIENLRGNISAMKDILNKRELNKR